MSIKDKVKSLLKEADLYKTQRLLKESKAKYQEALKLIQSNEQIQNRNSLISAITKKINILDTGIDRWEKSASKPEVSSKVQDLIKNLFTHETSEDSDAVKSLKSAITLAKFGQHSRAIDELNQLVKVESVAVAAAKNALKCIKDTSSIDETVEQFNEWKKNKVFSQEKENIIKNFLQDILDKEETGINLDQDEFIEEISCEENNLPDNGLANFEDEDDDIIDITSIGIRFSEGPKKGEEVELEVSFQAGNVLSLIISSNDQPLIESLKVGVKLDDMDFYSPIAIFKGSGIVESNTLIESGPKRGAYSLDIKINSI